MTCSARACTLTRLAPSPQGAPPPPPAPPPPRVKVGRTACRTRRKVGRVTATRIDADLLIPGRGTPVPDATVVFDGPTLDYVGPSSSAPETPHATTFHVAAVLPGMWDCHGHFFGVRTAGTADLYTDTVQLRSARAARDAEVALQAGFTSVREAGGLGVHLARGIEDGTLIGPSIYAPGAVLSTTGGHGDLHTIPLDWVHNISETSGELWLCDGVPECIRAVRAQLRLGAQGDQDLRVGWGAVRGGRPDPPAVPC